MTSHLHMLGAASLVSILTVLSVVALAESGGFDREARLAEALADYSAAQDERDRDTRLDGFARAARGFASLVEDGVRTPALYTNLGNASLQAGKIGEAVVAYHRALQLDPSAAAAEQNLAYVRASLPAWVPRPESDVGFRAALDYRRLEPSMRSTIAAIAFLVMALCLAIGGLRGGRFRRREGAWRGVALVAGIIWVVALATLVLESREGSRSIAVITIDGTPARSADSSLAPRALPEPLPAGVEVERLETRGEWTRVRLANRRDVWVRGSALTLVDDMSG